MPAVMDIWVIGDSFLKDIYSTYQMLEYQGFQNKKATQFYMSDYYNVKFYEKSGATGVSAHNAVVRIINATLEALNGCQTLPRLLLVIINKDVIESINLFDYGAYRVMAQVINWLTRQIDIMICRKRLQILEKCPDGIFNEYHPAIIYVLMIRRPQQFKMGSKMEAVCGLRTKFNNILIDAAARQNNHILSIRTCIHLDHFDHWGNLSHKGKITFWQELDNLVDRFKNDRLQLLPKVSKK